MDKHQFLYPDQDSSKVAFSRGPPRRLAPVAHSWLPYINALFTGILPFPVSLPHSSPCVLGWVPGNRLRWRFVYRRFIGEYTLL